MILVKLLGNLIRRFGKLGVGLGLVWSSGPRLALANAAVLVVQGLVPLAAVLLAKWVVDAVGEAALHPGSGSAREDFILYLTLAGTVALAAAVCRALLRLMAEQQSQAVSDLVHERIHQKSLELDLAYFDNGSFFDLLQRAQRESPSRPARLIADLVRLIQTILTLTVLGGLIAATNIWLAAFLCLGIIPALLVKLNTSRTIYTWTRSKSETERRASYISWLLTWSGPAKEVRFWGIGEELSRRFRELRRRLRKERLVITKHRSAKEFATDLGSTLTLYSALMYVGFQTASGHFTVGEFVMYSIAFQRMGGAAQELLSAVASLYESHLFLSSMSELLGLECTLPSSVDPVPFPDPLQIGITFDSVSFSYPGIGVPVLDGVSMFIPAGKTVAIVGENGAGKSTLVKLLCRLYDPTCGAIRFDGIDARQIDIRDLRKHIAVLFQDFTQFHLTIGDNIAFGDIERVESDLALLDAVERAGATPTLQLMPQGLNSLLGTMYGDGRELSLGQWQKVALARALYRGAGVLVLDEPTSSMDPAAEASVFRDFRRAVRNRTALIVSHRFTTVRLADRIYVLRSGGIVECGTHAELCAQNGTYSSLFNLEATYRP